MLKIENVSKSYGSKLAVDNLTLELKKGEIFGLLGPNGAGKTTTIKMLTGILPIDKGTITINGYNIATQPLEAKWQFSYVMDSPDLMLGSKGITYLNFLANVYQLSKAEASRRISILAERFDMTSVLNDKIQSYSHGMRQKMMVMGALINNPPLWVLDEPLTGLDPKSSFLLKEMMKEHTVAGNTVLFSTHVLEVAEKLCDRVGIISNGKLNFVGTLDELRAQSGQSSSLEQLFLELTESHYDEVNNA